MIPFTDCVDPDRLKPADLDLQCFQNSIIFIMTMVKTSFLCASNLTNMIGLLNHMIDQ